MRVRKFALASAAAVTALGPTSVAYADTGGFSSIKHIVVIYEENHSFDNLFGQWGSVNGQIVNGMTPGLGHNSQVGQDATALSCLDQSDVNLQNANNPAVPAPSCADSYHTLPAPAGPPTSRTS